MTSDRTETLKVSTVMLWMNSGCNARCITCEIWREKPDTYISVKDIAIHAPRWRKRGVRLVELCGEPTIHREFLDICAVLTANDLQFSVLSNGLRLARYVPFIVEHAVSLTVSLDGPPEVHNLVRGVPRAFDLLEQAVRTVRRISTTFPIYGRCAIHRENFHFMSETVETAKLLDLTSISFFGIDSDTAAFGREYLDPDDWQDRARMLTFTSNDMAALDLELERLWERHYVDFKRHFIAESTQLLSLSLSHHQRSRKRTGCLVIKCNAPFKSAVIEPNGNVKPCWFLPHHDNLHQVGDLHAVLEAPQAMDFRDGLDVSENEVCRKCITPRVFDNSGASKSGFCFEMDI